MVSCAVCGGKAVVTLRYLGISLCKDHFIEYFERRFLLTVTRLGMVERNDRVAVAVSGGKDSLTTLYLMNKYSNQLGIEVFAVAVDEGISGYREHKLEAARRLAERLGVELVVVSFDQEFGFTLDEMVEKASRLGLPYKPCTICGVLRRYLVNREARRRGATKVATGHNLDDEVQAFVMNALRNNLFNIAREGVVSGVAAHERFVPRIKPLYFTPEKESLLYSMLIGIETPYVECPYAPQSARYHIRRWLNRFESENPGTKAKLLVEKEIVARLIAARYAPEGVGTCRVCSEPSSGELCRACELLLRLGILGNV